MHADEFLSADSPSAVKEDIEKLRAILNQPERNQLKLIQAQLDALEFRVVDTETRAADTSEVLVKATQISNKRDDQYSNTLNPIVVQQFQTSSRENPEIMAEALFPILGPAIRKMITSMLSRDTNKAKRTYKFEQLFLIEKESGLPICHAKSGLSEAQDADMVSGMLSAIQSFVQDAFSTQEFDGLNTLQLGDLSVWIEWGPEAVIAAVIRGVAPESARTALQQLLEDIHSDYAPQLTAYEGDAEPFEPLKNDFALFMDNHDSRLINRVKKLPLALRKKLAYMSIALVVAVALLLNNQLDKRTWNNYVAKLDTQSGIVVTGSERSNGLYTVRGLKDPLAIDPAVLLANTSLDAEKVMFEFEPYTAMNTDFTLKRIKSVLIPSAGVDMDFDGSILRITGAKSTSWIAEAKRLSQQFPEVSQVIVTPINK